MQLHIYIYIRLRMCSYACVCVFIYIYMRACVNIVTPMSHLPAQCHQQAQSWPSQVVCQTRFGSWRFTFQRRPCLIAPALGVATWWGSIPGRVTEKRGTEKGVGDTKKKKNDKRGSSGWNTSTVGFYSLGISGHLLRGVKNIRMLQRERERERQGKKKKNIIYISSNS